MSQFTKALSNARRRVSRSGQANDHVRLYAGPNGNDLFTPLGNHEMLSHHEEQLQHYTGFVYSIIRTIANTIAGQPFHVGRIRKKNDLKSGASGKVMHKAKALDFVRKNAQNVDKSVEVIEDHPLLDAINKPNAVMGKWALIVNTFVCLEMCGVMYWWMRKPTPENGLKAMEIWPLPPHWVIPVHTNEETKQDKLFDHYAVTPSGYAQPMELSNTEVVMFFYPDPKNPIKPLSPMQALARTVMVDEQIEESKRRHFLNGHNPGLAVIVGKMPGTEGIQQNSPPILTVDQRAQITSALNQEWRGAVNHNNPIILDGMISDVKKIANTVQEMDYLQSGDAAENRLAQGWGISKMILGEMQNANRAGSTVAKKHFYDIVTNPRIAMFSEALTHEIAPLFTEGSESADGIPDDELLAWIEPCVAMDEDFDLQTDIAMYDRGVISRNEWRAKKNMPLLEEGDSAIVGGVLIPVVAVKEGQAPRPVQRPEPVNPREDEETEEDVELNQNPNREPNPKRSWAKAKILDVPDFRQNKPWDCGAIATKIICEYFGLEDKTEDEYIEALGSTEAEGTPPDHIVKYLTDVGLVVLEHHSLSVDNLACFLEAGSPVMVVIQDYEDTPAEIVEQSTGHYVVVIGIERVGDDYKLTLQDPWAGRVEMGAVDFLSRWHDHTEDDTFVHFGIAVSKPGGKSAKSKKVPTLKSWHDRLGVLGHVKVLDQQAQKAQKEFQDNVQEFLIQMGQRVGDDIRRHVKGNSMIDGSLVDLIVHDSDWTDGLKAVCEPLMLKSAMAGAVLEWNLHQPQSEEKAAKGLFSSLVPISSGMAASVKRRVAEVVAEMKFDTIVETVRGRIKAVVDEAKDAVIGAAAVADRVVDKVFGRTETAMHAAAIAGTESQGAFNCGGSVARQNMAMSGLITRQVWKTMGDSSVRESHRKADGQTRLVSEKFVLGDGREAMYPGDQSLPPEDRCNCRCYCVGVKN